MAQMKKKKTTARWLKVSLAQNPWLSGTKLKKRDYCAQFTTREDACYPGHPQLCPPAHPGTSSRLHPVLQTEVTCSFWPQFRCVGTWVCRWRTLRGTGERDNLRASPFSGVIHLVTWGTVALRMHLTQWAVSLIPLFSVLRTTQTLFDAIITVKVPASAAPSLPAATITPKSSSDKLEIIVSLGEQTLKLKISTYFICPCRECLFLSLII